MLIFHLCVLFMSFAHFLIRFLFVCFALFWLNFESFFMYSRYQPFVEYVVCKHFFPVCSLSSHSLNRVFCRIKFFKILMHSSISIFLIYHALCLGVMFKNSLLNLRSQRFSPIFFSISFIVLFFF